MSSWIINVVVSTSYAGIVLLMFVENVFPPIPSELIMPLAGFLAAQGKLGFVGIVIAGTAGSVLGALPLYYLGRRLGEERVKRFADRYGRWLTVSRSDLVRAKRWFDRHGGAATLLARLVPGIRSLISIPAGIARMPLAPFLAYTAAGASLWTLVLASLGYLLGSRFPEVERYFDPAAWIVLGGLAVYYVSRVIRHKGDEETDR